MTAAAGGILVRVGLRPLTRIEGTAEAIASGELNRRLPREDGRTEVAQLTRSLNLMLDRLGQAYAEKHRSEQLLRSFIADASHDLRTPLTSVRGFAELYRHQAGPSDPVAQELLARIEREAARMGLLVEDLMLLAQADQYRSLDLAETDLIDLCREAVNEARARQPNRSIIFDPLDSRVRTVADRFRLHQVLSNLLNNALTHTPPTDLIEVRVGTELWRKTAAALTVGQLPQRRIRMVFFEVHDHGPGIPAADLPHIFDRFYRAGAAANPAASTGLGLAIVAALVQAHDGHIELVSTTETGSSFRVWLPVEGPIET